MTTYILDIKYMDTLSPGKELLANPYFKPKFVV